ncbi:MAG TPA: substrate-binding domain-containing protein [Terriglobales bacterium]|jgi:D-xylose transport system substrate-binding protein|nr:substrate-binding domain-containing protein [Terriglobales bacterium]
MRPSPRFFIGVSCVLIVLTLGVAPAQKKEIKIGFSIEDIKGERWQTDLDEFQRRAHELGGAVVTRSANGDDDLQFRQINELLEGGIDVLVFLPHDTSKAERMVEAAHAKHVPVISYDRLASAPVDLYVGFDLFSVGLEQAQSLVDLAPKGNYLLLGGSPLDANSKVVRAGQMKVLQPFIDRGDIHVLADVWVPEWSATEAYVMVTEELAKLKAAPTAIVASNDAIAGGAIQALEDKGWSGRVLVSGQDADLAAIERIFAGSQLMTVYKPVGDEARAAAEAAMNLARHQDVDSGAEVPNGLLTTKAILLTPICVTEENAKQTVLKDGFQKLEVVKQGLPKDKQAQLDKP